MFQTICRTLAPLNLNKLINSHHKVLYQTIDRLRFVKPANSYSSVAHKPYQENLPSQQDELLITKSVIDKVNEQIKNGEEGRLFAVVHLCGKQFKVTAEDLIIVEGYWPPQNSDEIKLEKILLVGGFNFTLIGRPILPPDLVTVKATVIEKDLSHTKPLFYKKRRKQYMRLTFYRSQTTMLRINEVSIKGKIDEHQDVIQYERA